MEAPLKPLNEKQRLAELESLMILDTPDEERFDRVTRLAARYFKVPIALISLIDESRQWFKSSYGLNASETHRNVSFCGHTILNEDVFVVENAADDNRFSDNPLVTGDPGIRFYAGYPLQVPSGHKIGTLCLIDRKPRDFSLEDAKALADLGQIVETELKLHQMNKFQNEILEKLSLVERRAAVDSLTRLWNREYVLKQLELENELARREKAKLNVAMIDIDHFKNVNDQYGHLVGDEALRVVAARLRRTVRPYDILGRYGGEEFLLIFTQCDSSVATKVAERIRLEIAKEPIKVLNGNVPITISMGLGSFAGGYKKNITDILSSVDKALYKAKSDGRNRIEIVQYGN